MTAGVSIAVLGINGAGGSIKRLPFLLRFFFVVFNPKYITVATGKITFSKT